MLNSSSASLLAGPLGLAGVALGTAIPNVLFAVVVLAIACRELGIPMASYLGYVVPRAALGALPVLALLLWFRLGLRRREPAGPGRRRLRDGRAVRRDLDLLRLSRRSVRRRAGHLVRLRAWSRA